jgi:hypothetical protein
MRITLHEATPQIDVRIPAARPDDEDGWIRVNVLGLNEIAAIARRHTKWRRGREERDDRAMSEELWDRTIVDWNFRDAETGEPIACNQRNKNLLVNRKPYILDRIQDAIDAYREDRQEALEAEEKN